MSNFKRILPFAMPYKKYAYLNILFNILYALFSTLSFIALIPMIKVLFDQTERNTVKPHWEGIAKAKDYAENMLSYFITTTSDEFGPGRTLAYMVGGIIFIFLLKNLCDYLALFFITFLKNGMLRDIRNTMYRKVIDLPLAFYSEKRKGDVISRMSGDVNEVQNSFLAMLELIVKEPMTILFTIIMMFAISTKLTLFVFIFIPISGYIISIIGKSLKRKSTRAQQEFGRFLSTIEETLGGLKVIKSYNSEGYFAKVFRQSTDRYFKLNNSIGNRQNLASPMSEFMGIVIIATLLWYGGNMVLVERTLDGANFIAYMGLAYNILTPAKAISKASYAIKRGNAAADRILEIIEQPNPIVSKPDALEKETFDGKLSLENITFSYDDKKDVLRNFSLEVNKGQTVALVGQSGSGKSTIANLLTRFYDVNSGAVKIDDTDIRDIHLTSLRDLMGLVTQDSILFNDSIRNNITLGKIATDEEIIEALKVANAYEFVKDLPGGLETNIGDSGNKLSGGQKQRLSIARAVLKNPPIMILDEATSALDTESERLVQQALENMMQHRTSVVIAHRLSTIQKADVIVVMQKGEIIERGTHNELIAREGMYKKLVQMQSFD